MKFTFMGLQRVAVVQRNITANMNYDVLIILNMCAEMTPGRAFFAPMLLYSMVTEIYTFASQNFLADIYLDKM